MDLERKPGSRDVNKRYGERTRHHVNKNGEALRGQGRKTPLMTLALEHRTQGESDHTDPRTGMLPSTQYSVNKHKRWELLEQLEAEPAVAVRHEPNKAMMRRRGPSLHQVVRHRAVLASKTQESTVPLEAVYTLYRDPTRAQRKAHAVHNSDGNKCRCPLCYDDAPFARCDKRKDLVHYGMDC